MPADKYWVGLNMVLGVGKTRFHRLLRIMGSPRRIFNATRNELKGIEGIGDKIADEIKGFDFEKNVDREFRLAEKFGVRILTLESSEYPPLLKSIYDPPPVLYYKGESLSKFPIPIAMVGSRSPSNYGKLVAERLSARLAEQGICVVSGMARGIDTVCHKHAIKAGGNTLAVFGCGLSITYPPENVYLKETIVKNGGILSEFPITAKPDKNNFPARNRVISGLSYGTIVVEAGEKSGALITAQFALEQGREVFAVPGNINSPQSRGTNRLIGTGAKLIEGPESVIEELPEEIQSLLRSSADEVKETVDMSEKEKLVFSFLSHEETHIDSIIENSRLSPAEVSATLVQLELKGIVRQEDGKMFITSSGN
ncbi:MAG: DNA-processing protein DprA [Nitrospinales bacterium]